MNKIDLVDGFVEMMENAKRELSAALATHRDNPTMETASHLYNVRAWVEHLSNRIASEAMRD